MIVLKEQLRESTKEYFLELLEYNKPALLKGDIRGLLREAKFNDEIYYYVIRLLILNSDNVYKLVAENYNGNLPEHIFDLQHILRDVIIPSLVTSIGKYAFYKCENLEKVIMNDSVKEIGESIFNKCNKLLKVKLSNNLEVIPESAFFNCDSLGEIDIPKSVTKIQDAVFLGCTSLHRVGLQEGLEYIGDGVFYRCHSLKELYIPLTVNKINGELVVGQGKPSMADQITIKCKAGSYAEDYAKENNLKVEIV